MREKVADLQARIKADTGLSLVRDDIVCYSAGYYNKRKQTQDKPYNILQLEKMILSKIPKQKRVVQRVEESKNAHDQNDFWDSVVDFVDMVTDHIPAVRDLKKAGKKLWDILTGWW